MLTLYSTWGCHLCEEAEALLRAAGATVTIVDIVDVPDAFALYRTEIPVLVWQTNAKKAELKWPFDTADLSEFLQQRSL